MKFTTLSRHARLLFGAMVLGTLFITMSSAQEIKPSLVFPGHQDAVYSVALSPDGTLLATASFDKSVKLWDARTGKELRVYTGPNGHQNSVLNVTFSPGGDSIATAGADNTARIWDIPVNTPTKEYVPSGPVNAVSGTADGKMLAAAGKDGSVKLWTIADGKQAANFAGHPGGATSIAFGANGQLLLSGGVDQTIRYWNPATGQPIATIGAHAAPVTGVAIFPNNNLACSVGEDGLIKWWTLPIVLPRALPGHGDAVTALALSNDGAQVLSAGADKTVKTSNFTNGQVLKEFAGAGAAINTLAPAANGKQVVGGGADGKLYVWNNDDTKLVAQPLLHAGAITSLVFHPAQPQLLTAGADGNLKTWSWPIALGRIIPAADRVLAVVPRADGTRLFYAGADKIIRSHSITAGMQDRQFAGHTGPVTALALSADAALLVSAASDESIRFWNTANATQTAQLNGHVGGVTSLALASQGNVLASGGEDGTVKIWQTPPTAAKTHTHPEPVLALAVSPDGARFLTIGNDKQARLWNVASGQSERSYTAGSGVISAVAFAPDNTTVAIAGADKSLVISNAGKEIKKFDPLPSVAQALAFSANGATLAVGLADNSLRLFNVADGKEIKNIPGHGGPISAVLFNAKGDLLLSASADKTVRLWNPADGTAKGQFTHAGPVTALAISKDGTRLAAGGSDKTISMWTLADNKPAGTISTTAEVRGLSFNPDGTRLAVAGGDGKVRVFGLDGKLQESFTHDGPVSGVAFLADGKRLISTSADKTAKLWTASLVAQGHHTGPVRQVIIAPAGDRIFSVGDDKHLRIWDAKTGKELKAIAAHDGPILGLGVSTDLAKVVTASADKTAKVWTIADGKMVTTIPLAGPAQAVTMSPNGNRLAVAFADPATHVRAYDAATGKELQALADPAAPVRSLSFLPDNRTILSAGDDKQLSFLDVAALGVLPVNAGGVAGVALSANGTQAITAGKDKFVRLWDLAGGKELKNFGAMESPITALSVSRDFAVVAAASGKLVKVWQIADGKELAAIVHPADVTSLSFNTDKTRISTGAMDNLARVFEVATGRLVQAMSHGAAVRGVAFHPVQATIVTASADKTVTAHPITLNKLVAASAQPLRAVAVTANGQNVITAGDDKNVKIWNAASGAEERSCTGAEGPVLAVAVSKNGQLIAAAGADKTIRIYTLADAKLVGAIPVGNVVRGVAFHPTQPFLVSVQDDQSVTAWNIAFVIGQPVPAEFGKAHQGFTHPQSALGVAFNDLGNLFTAGNDKTVRQWKVAGDAAFRNFAHPQLVDCVAFDPTGKILATGCHDGQLRLFDIEKNNALNAIPAHTMPQPAPIYALAWHPDGKQIVTASYDKSLKLWDTVGGKVIREFKPYTEKMFDKGHRDQVFCAVFTKDGKFLATGSSDRMIKLWNVADGTVVREFANPNIKQLPAPESPEAHPGWVYGLCFSKDEKQLFSVGSAPKNSGYLAVWNVADGKMITKHEIPNGPLYSVILTKDGNQLVLGCGPRNRQMPISEALIVPIPK